MNGMNSMQFDHGHLGLDDGKCDVECLDLCSEDVCSRGAGIILRL